MGTIKSASSGLGGDNSPEEKITRPVMIRAVKAIRLKKFNITDIRENLEKIIPKDPQ